MSTCLDIDAERAALMRAMGADASDSPVATPEMIANGLLWLLAKNRQELASRPTGQQEYARAGELARKYGYGEAHMHAILRRLRQAGKVDYKNAPTAKKGGKGDTLYKIADIDAALTENALSYDNDNARH